jgi:hypothetical protein
MTDLHCAAACPNAGRLLKRCVQSVGYLISASLHP